MIIYNLMSKFFSYKTQWSVNAFCNQNPATIKSVNLDPNSQTDAQISKGKTGAKEQNDTDTCSSVC